MIATGSAWGNYKDKSKAYSSADKAREAYDKAIAAKRAAGFREVAALADPTVLIARDPKLEAAIRANRNNPQRRFSRSSRRSTYRAAG